MRGRFNLRYALLAAGAATLWLAGCGGGSKTAKQADTSHTSRASAQSTSTGATTTRSTTSSSATPSSTRLYAAEARGMVVYLHCLRANGVTAPKPNTSGHGPLLNEKEIATSSPAFKRYNHGCLLKGQAVYEAALR